MAFSQIVANWSILVGIMYCVFNILFYTWHYKYNKSQSTHVGAGNPPDKNPLSPPFGSLALVNAKNSFKSLHQKVYYKRFGVINLISSQLVWMLFFTIIPTLQHTVSSCTKSPHVFLLIITNYLVPVRSIQ